MIYFLVWLLGVACGALLATVGLWLELSSGRREIRPRDQVWPRD